MFTLFFILSFFEKKNVLTVILSLLTIRKLVAQIEEKTGNTMMVKKKLFEIWLHLDVHLQEIVKIVVCNSDIGFKKIGESLYTTKILASKKLLKVSMPPRYWLRRNW